jgi:ABC-type sugar transport system permease subunit
MGILTRITLPLLKPTIVFLVVFSSSASCASSIRSTT